MLTVIKMGPIENVYMLLLNYILTFLYLNVHNSYTILVSNCVSCCMWTAVGCLVYQVHIDITSYATAVIV